MSDTPLVHVIVDDSAFYNDANGFGDGLIYGDGQGGGLGAGSGNGFGNGPLDTFAMDGIGFPASYCCLWKRS